MANATKLGIVVIGRNEGERLRRCLLSAGHTKERVYVDSGSTDGSQKLAAALGFDVVELDAADGFTAARARNAGIRRLAELRPDIETVQVVDGDCEIRKGWLQAALADLQGDIAVVFGRRRERYPDKNAYHRACDIEWMVQAGIVNSCGGDAVFRIDALRSVGGYNPDLIAGEEPDLCLRLRQSGWRIFSNDVEMTWHDVAISRFGQWWQRAKRAGYAFAELVEIHGPDADPHWRRLLVSALVWSTVLGGLIAFIVLGLIFRNGLLFASACALALLLCAGVGRTASRRRHDFSRLRDALSWGFLLYVSKLAQTQGLMMYRLRRRGPRARRIIEYK